MKSKICWFLTGRVYCNQNFDMDISSWTQKHCYKAIIVFILFSNSTLEPLSGFRERFLKLYADLKTFYNGCLNIHYLRQLVSIPKMPDNPPDFHSTVPEENHKLLFFESQRKTLNYFTQRHSPQRSLFIATVTIKFNFDPFTLNQFANGIL